jgi:carbon storage regulator
MLILTRRIGEAVRIGSNVRIQILSQHGNQVRIGIHAPKTIEVHREEVFERIQQERNTEASPPSRTEEF